MRNVVFPLEKMNRVVFLNQVIHNPQIEIGDYTYYDDIDNPLGFEKNVLYLFDFIGDKLKIGKFCQLAQGVKFIMNGGNHDLSGLSTFPFNFLKATEKFRAERRPDIIVGNDVWIGYNATILSGITIGDGAIIGACSVVTKDIAPYTIVAGNPARVIRKRFSEEQIQSLLELKWWDWPIEKIKANINFLTGQDI